MWSAFFYLYLGVEDENSSLSIVGGVHALFFIPIILILFITEPAKPDSLVVP